MKAGLLVLASLLTPASAHAGVQTLAPEGVLTLTITSDDALVELSDLPAFAFGSTQSVRGVRVPLAIERAGVYRVELHSSSFDGLLVARDEDGRLLAFDDDGFDGGLDALLVLPIDPDEPVELLACALHGALGTAQVSLQRATRMVVAGHADVTPELARQRERHKLSEELFGARHVSLLESLVRYGKLLGDQGQRQAARSLLARAVDLGDDLRLAGDTWFAIASMLLSDSLLASDEYALARASYERTLELVEANVGRGHPDSVSSLGGLALACKRLGDLRAARDAYELALAILDEARPGDLEGATLRINLAELLREMGDFEAARRSLERALETLEAALGEDDADVASCRNNLGVLLSELGDDAAARVLLEGALATRERLLGPDHPHVAVTLNNLAALDHRAHDFASSRRLAERALAIREAALGPQHPEVADQLANLGLLLESQGDLVGARTGLERALAVREHVFGADHPSVAESLADLATLTISQGAFGDARELLDRAIAASRRHLLGQVAGLAESDALRLVSRAWTLYETRLSPLLLGDDAQSLAAYDDLLAWKAQVLRTIRIGRQRLRAELPTDALQALDRLQQVTGELSRLASGEPSSVEQLGELLDERNRLERLVSRERGELSHESVGWTQLRDALPPDGALVDAYVQRFVAPGVSVSEPHVVVWVTRADSVRPARVDLGLASTLDATVAALLEPIASARGASPARPPTSAAATTKSAYDLLWTPLEPLLRGARRVFVSPDGVLAAVPLEVLRGPDGRYLVEDHGFVYLTDPTDVVRIARRPPPARAGDLLVVGDVDFDHVEGSVEGPLAAARDPGRASASAHGPLGAHWEALVATAGEARDVSNRHAAAFADAQRTLLLGPAATEEALKRLLPTASYVHLATHGYFDESQRLLETYHPGLLSGLVCAGANAGLTGSRDDGYLTAEEVGWIDLGGAELVVLSACDTGLGRAQSGEGLLGLRRAFLAAGAHSVLSSLWSVPDQETADFMDRFYANLWQRGLGLHDALRTTQLELLAEQRGSPGGRVRPVTWGAFVLDGDWR